LLGYWLQDAKDDCRIDESERAVGASINGHEKGRWWGRSDPSEEQPEVGGAGRRGRFAVHAAGAASGADLLSFPRRRTVGAPAWNGRVAVFPLLGPAGKAEEEFPTLNPFLVFAI
jgi:hypothetical protein